MSDPTTDSRPNTPLPVAKMPGLTDMAQMAGKSPIEMVMQIAKKSGPIFELPGQPDRTLVVWGYPYVDEVSGDDRFDKALATGLVALRKFAGDGLFTAYTDEPNWGLAHRILLPAFSQQAMAGYHDRMLDLASQLVLKWSRLNPGETVNVPEDMTRLTLDTIGLCGFDYRFNSFYRTELHPYVQGMIYTLDLATGVIAGGGNALPDDPKLDEYRVAMNDFVDHIIATRKASGLGGTGDLLGKMLEGVDKQTGERLADETIRHEINTFLVAGHETTSGLLSFALYFLSKHPDILRKAQAEADRVLGPHAGVLPTYQQVRELVYTRQVLDESLRLWPTAPGFSRRPLAPDTLGGEYRIEPTDVIRVLTPLLHRDPAVWGDDAEEFNPDRFAPGRAGSIPANAFKPFGTGQRACIGRQFALHEATLVLGMLMHRFDLDDVTNYQLRIKQTLTIKPEDFSLGLTIREGRNTFVFGNPGMAADSQPATGDVAAATPPAGCPAHLHAASATPKAASHGTPLLVLYGSNLGSAEDLAYRVANEGAARGFAATVAPLDDYVGRLAGSPWAVIVTASYNGTPPDNAAAFCAWMQDPALGGDAFAGTSYAVFGCGNREWAATYQKIPRLIDDALAAHGATRLAPRGEGDMAGDFDDAANDWLADFWPVLSEAAGVSAEAGQTGPLYSVDLVSAPANPLLGDVVRAMQIRENRELQHGDERSTRHLEIALPEGVSYRTGDHLGVMARNGIETVARVLRRWNFAGDAFVRVGRNGAGSASIPVDRPIALVDLLSRYVDLQDVASRAHIQTLAARATDPGERAALAELAAGQYDAEVLAKRASPLDLLERFPSVDLPFAVFLEMVHPLRVRYYSISSSPAVSPQTASLTVAVVDAPARSGSGQYRGAASTYLSRHPAGSMIDAYVRQPNLPFRPPADPATPIIMVGPGTGFAPFRGFLQDRAATLASGHPLGPAMLFYGCRNPDRDFIYRDEIERWSKHGIVDLHTAFSRPDSGDGCYVQDRLREQGAKIWDLMNAGGVFYVCGDGGKMEPAVREALIEIAQQHGGRSEHEASAWQAELARSSRYLADVWASS